MVGKLFQEVLLFLMTGERGCHLELFMCERIERNGSAQNGSKTSCKRKRLHKEALQSFRVNAALFSSVND